MNVNYIDSTIFYCLWNKKCALHKNKAIIILIGT